MSQKKITKADEEAMEEEEQINDDQEEDFEMEDEKDEGEGNEEGGEAGDDDENIEEDEEAGDEAVEDEEVFEFAEDDAILGFDENATTTDEFKVLDAEKLINQQQKEVIHTSEVLSIPVGVAGTVLRKYNFNKERLFSDFFEDKDKCIRKCGVNLNDLNVYIEDAKKICECPICYNDVPGSSMLALSCKHFFCKGCWKDYLTDAIAGGAGCLHTKCPNPKCDQIITEQIVKEMVEENTYKTYSKYLSRSFVDDNPNICWCPAPDCGKAILCDLSVNEVQCSCGNKFCFKCKREAHAPASCDELTNWLKKEKDESETANYLSANTKSCPKCKRPIEKNGGCNHMSCSLCKYEFCWVCMDDWKKHDSETGGFYKCNRYNPDDLKKKLKEEERDSARLALEKYMHYYKRYSNHGQSQKFEKELREKTETKMKHMQKKNKFSSWVDVEFIQKAVDQLIECRRSLKFTYVYGYYLEDGPQKQLFEFLQEDLEKTTEKLSEVLEAPVDKFNRDDIIAITKSAETRLHNLLKGQ